MKSRSKHEQLTQKLESYNTLLSGINPESSNYSLLLSDKRKIEYDLKELEQITDPFNTRITNLRNAIAYSRAETKIMSYAQGIMCHQEIAAIFKVQDGITEVQQYRVSPALDRKISEINELIKKNKLGASKI